MDNKTIGPINRDRGHLLENSDKGAFLIEKESIKIPFVNYNERKLPQKSFVISIQQPPYHEQLKRRKKQLLTRFKVNQKINQQTVFVYGKSYPNKKQSHGLTGFFKTKSISPQKKQTMKNHKHHLAMSATIEKSQQCPESEDYDNELLNIKAYKQNSLLPNIGLHKMKQRYLQKFEKKKRRKEKSNLKTQKSRNQLVKKCYSVDLSSRMNDVLPTAKRLKTQQEMQNQFILKKIVLAKPTPDLSRMRLKDRYQKFEEYKLIRQRKSPIFSPKSFLLGRSSTIKKSPEKKYIKI